MSPNSNRERGDYLERQAREALRELGWFVVRAGGSLGPADLVALRAGYVPLLVGCKTNGEMGPRERDAMVDAGELAGARPLLAWRPKRGVIELRTVHRGVGGLTVATMAAPKR